MTEAITAATAVQDEIDRLQNGGDILQQAVDAVAKKEIERRRALLVRGIEIVMDLDKAREEREKRRGEVIQALLASSKGEYAQLESLLGLKYF